MRTIYLIIFCLFIISTTFAQPANDDFANAIDVTGIINSCSTDAAYTTLTATSDATGSTCLAGSPNYNVWFSFTAPASGNITVTIDRDGASKGDIRRVVSTIFDTDGTTELACNSWVSDNDVVKVSALGLTPGLTYFISVDNHSTGGYRGTFTLCLDDVLDYDYIGGAIDVDAFINSCSSDAAYTTIGATADATGSSCLAGSPNFNRWFSFTAPASGNINVTIDRDGASKGDIRRVVATIFDTDGTTELACNRWVSDNDVVKVSALGLTPGLTYFISVDNHSNGGYRGTFTLCLDDVLDYDYIGGAIDVDAFINSCSSDAAYTTIGATADATGSSCLAGSPNFNRWFSFTAPASGNISVTVDRDGASKGDIRRVVATIFDTDGTTELACNSWVSDNDVVKVSALGLTPGLTYFISVDNHSTGGYRGTFTLCLDDVLDYDYIGGAIDVDAFINSCSANAAYTTIGATADATGSSCLAGSTNFNRWFSFTAPASGNISVTVDRDGASKGTIRRVVTTIFDTDGTTELACNSWVSDNDVVKVSALGLTPGLTYFISVDNHSIGGYRGTFTLCLDDVLDYDYIGGAIDVDAFINSCSANAAYTTIGATADATGSSCLAGSPNFNRWFSFTAPASGNISVTVDRDGASKGTIRRVVTTIFDTDGTTELACNSWVGDNDVVKVSALGLTPGLTYFISVDNHSIGGYRGTFTLCLDDVLDYDYIGGAIDVDAFINSCSANAAYTTIGATADATGSSCLAGSPNFNRWFSFTAPASGNINVTVDRDGASKGDIRRVVATIFDTDGTTELACNSWISDNDVVKVSALGLTPGLTYFISVDNHSIGGYRGTFTLCLDDVLDYDYIGGAVLLTDINNFCSTDAIYTTNGATPDATGSSCLTGSPNYNRWFKFVATTSFINVVVDRNGGSKGNIRRVVVTIFDTDGTTELACNRWVSDDDVVKLSAIGLTPGLTYFISVDNHSAGGYRGTFTLCLDDEPDYDLYEGAIELTNLNNWCSSDAEFTTIGATSDKTAGSCWVSGPTYNRWFKFTAISTNVTIQVLRGGSQGDIRRIQLALWDSNGTSEVDCSRYVGDNDNVTITNTGLIIGNTYYISVDNHSAGGYRGSFTLCIDNVDQNYYSIASGAWTNGNNWSFSSHVGPAAGSSPSIGDVANIEGHTMTITTTETIAVMNINAATNNTGLTISNGTLNVAGQFNITNPGNNFNNVLTVSNGVLSINDDFNVNRNGGTAIISATISNSTVNINKDFTINSTAGSGNNTISISTLSNFTIGGELTLSNSGGPNTSISVDNSDLTIDDNLNFTATSDNQVGITISTGADLFLGRNIIRGTPAYGYLTSSGNSIVHYNSANNLQTMAATTGSGTGDVISYENITINNSRITTPQITAGGVVNITGILNLLDGEVRTTLTNLITLNAGSTLSGGSAASFIDGPLKKIGNTDFTFQSGNNNYWAPIDIANLTGDAATEFTAQYFQSAYGDISNLQSPDPNGDLNNVSSAEYWTLDNSGTASNADVTLNWKDQDNSGIDDYADLVIVHYNTGNSEWENLGQSSIVGSDPGSITVTGVSSFSPLTFGSMSSTSNPLPVELTSLEAIVTSNSVIIKWSTASEINNDRFDIERSHDGLKFEKIGALKGNGSTTEMNKYQFEDRNPIIGASYYRLKQVDFDGKFQNSSLLSVNFDQLKYSLFPNPVIKGELYLQLISGVTGYGKLTLINAMGQSAFTEEFTFEPLTNQNLQIDLKNLPKGIYILKMQIDNKILKERVIIK